MASIVLTAIVLLGVTTRSPIAVWRVGLDSVALVVAYLFMIRLVYVRSRLFDATERISKLSSTNAPARAGGCRCGPP